MMKNYESTIRLRRERDQTQMKWTASFDPEPGPGKEVTGMIKGIFQTGIDSLTQRFGS